MVDAATSSEEAQDLGQDFGSIDIPSTADKELFPEVVSWGEGRLSFRPDLALRADLLFLDILKRKRAALLSIDTSSGAPTFS